MCTHIHYLLVIYPSPWCLRIGHDESCGLTFLNSLHKALESGVSCAESLVPQAPWQRLLPCGTLEFRREGMEVELTLVLLMGPTNSGTLE